MEYGVISMGYMEYQQCKGWRERSLQRDEVDRESLSTLRYEVR